MQRLYVVCGQSGVGKTTVVDRVARELGDLTVLNFGERILAMALAKGLVSDPQGLRTLRPEALAKLQIQAAQYISGLGGMVILDMHLTVKTPAGYVAGMPKQVMETLNPARIILLEADPGQIMARRLREKGDKGRLRPSWCNPQLLLRSLQRYNCYRGRCSMRIMALIWQNQQPTTINHRGHDCIKGHGGHSTDLDQVG
jgi:adenylate kinase